MDLTFKFDRLSTTFPEKESEIITEEEKSIELYTTPSHARNVCFIDEKGVQTFLNYSYLVTGEFNPSENSIQLTFSTHTISLKGFNLQSLFDQFLNFQMKKAQCFDKRYTDLNNKSVCFINYMKILKNLK